MTRFVLLLAVAVLSGPAHAREEAKAKPSTKKVIKYQKHTTLDFSEQTIQGRVRSPDVFYIFQRRRSEGPRMVDSPAVLESLRRETRSVVEEIL